MAKKKKVARAAKKSLRYFDYFEVEGLVAEMIGRDIRDFRNKRDFWAEYVAEQIPGNDCYTMLFFEEEELMEPWVKEVCAAFREVIGADSAVFHISW